MYEISKIEGHDANESSPRIITPPAVEALYYGPTPESPWPTEIFDDPELRRQVAERAELSRQYAAILGRLPCEEVDMATEIANGTIGSEEVSALYETLARTLESDASIERIALYLPLEFLSSSKNEDEIHPASQHLRTAYKSAWTKLLTQHDLRANYLDGDIPEPAHRDGPLPEVVKAAHLIPGLVSRGILSTAEVIGLMEETSDDVLSSSIADTLPTLHDIGMLSTEDLERMTASQNATTRSMAKIIQSYVAKEVSAEIPKDILSIVGNMRAELTRTDTLLRNTDLHADARANWLHDVDADRIITKNAQHLGLLLLENKELSDSVKEIISGDESEDVRILCSEALREVLTRLAREDANRASLEYHTYEIFLKGLWDNAGGKLRNSLSTLFLHCYSLGVVDGATLNSLGITLPHVDAPFEERLGTIKEETAITTEIAERISRHPLLSRMLYPITVMLGSRMKGYAKEKADLDVAVFVRPEVGEEERAHLEALVREAFDFETVGGHAMEFWLKDTDGKLWIKDYEDPDPQRGDSTLPHPLLGAWCGDKVAIGELYQRLMPEYLYSKDKTILGKDARGVWLKEMEHTMLQYRLMHKGYHGLYPKQAGLQTNHSDDIDGASAFYDPGYRRLATKLFIDKVFLPQIDRPK